MDPFYEAFGYFITVAVLFFPVVWFIPYFIWSYYRLNTEEKNRKLIPFTPEQTSTPYESHASKPSPKKAA